METLQRLSTHANIPFAHLTKLQVQEQIQKTKLHLTQVKNDTNTTENNTYNN